MVEGFAAGRDFAIEAVYDGFGERLLFNGKAYSSLRIRKPASEHHQAILEVALRSALDPAA